MLKGMGWVLRRVGIGVKPPVMARTSPLFTIVIPTCDRPDALTRALESVRRQSDPRWSVIIVDDGRAPAVLPEALVHAMNLKVLRTSGRIGAAAARNLGMAMANTPWVVFLDDDDELLPGFLGALAERVSEQVDTPVLAITDQIVLDYDAGGALLGERQKIYRSADGPLGHDIHQALRSGMCGLAVNRLALARAGPVDPSYRLLEDTEWILRLIESGSRIVFISPPGLLVHSNPSIDRLSNPRHFQARIAECRRLQDRYQTLDGLFPGVGPLFDAMIAGMERQLVTQEPTSPSS